MARTVLLQKSEDGDVRLYDRRDQFQACCKSGQWFNELIFNDDDLEDFYLIIRSSNGFESSMQLEQMI